MKVFVTGASGLLAINTISCLLENGYTVKALIRDKQKSFVPESKQLEYVEGDITNLQLLEAVIQDCDYVVHAAAETRQSLVRWNDYFKINVEGTRNICSAAVNNKVKRFIHISTVNVFGYGTQSNPGNETSPIKAPFSNSLYVESKLQAQKIALSYSNNMEVIVLNPTFLIGPHQRNSGSGRIILRGLNKKLVFYPPGGKNFIHVKDAAQGIVNALTKAENRELYILANENLNYKEFYERLAKLTQTKPLLIRIPKFILWLMGTIGNLLKLMGINNEFTMVNMKIVCVNNFYSGEKARTILGIGFKSIDEAINDFLVSLHP